MLDVGLTYTKCGFVKDSLPLHVIQTPLSMIQALHNSHETYIYTYQTQQQNSKSIRENLSQLKSDSFPKAFRHEQDRLENEI